MQPEFNSEMHEFSKNDHVQQAQIIKKARIQHTVQIPTTNQYEMLTIDDDGPNIVQNGLNSHATSSNPQQRPPPFNIIGLNISTTDNLLKQIKVTDYEIKLTTEGIRLFTKTIDIFKLVKAHLLANKVQFYTHQLREERMTKFVLHGLPDTTEAEINQGLNTAGVFPTLIKKMKIKRARYDGHAVYLIYFLKTQNVKLNCLVEKCKVISYVRVKWEHYKNPEKGPTQCRNCLRYGHGSNNCSAAARCIRCALNHSSGDCPLLKDQTGKIVRDRVDNSLLKCALCNLNHPASSKNCPKRKDFINAKKPHYKSFKRTNTEKGTFIPAPQLNDFNFPRLSHNTKQKDVPEPTKWQNKSTIPTEESDPHNGNGNLFSRSQLLSIFMEMTSQLSQAKTKSQQVQILMDIALKHCVNE
ncbi:hypothetical protein PVAND_004484 [Polypedilum vanderplanki]|uniref:Nucleic-acid-binding protein from transposon X-element n=1 Tax=Polypedilum vanderplanki TaxID=319348 RepID=A0A9J6BXP8_POLVA|nr:hypothetical protein PVAND_004484 [Polypedilum vanderplanki]